MSKICVIGEGKWGTAIASLLSSNGYEVNLWCYDPKVADSINKHNINNVYFPEYILSKKIKAFVHIGEAINQSEWIFEAIPVKFLRNVLQDAKPFYNNNQKWIILSKGFEKSTFFLPSQILDDVFQLQVKKAVILGPSFANDLITHNLTMVDMSCSVSSIESNLKKILETDYFKINLCNDLIGMQICAALKNIVAIIMGIAEAKNYSDNTKAYVFTKCIAEVKELLEFFECKKETILSFSGIGDLILTCFGKHSKNLKLGLQLAQEENIQKILANKNLLPEGINSIESINDLIKKNNLNMPIFSGIYNFIFNKKKFDELFI